ncbi:MAG: carboxypeptidase-like regulatory domain-containing protein [Spirosomataceae bacterium]
MKNILFLLIMFSSGAFAQSIKGNIKDSQNQVLPGVIVSIIGEKGNVVFSDEKGDFSIKPVTRNPKLVFTLLGFNSDTILVKDNSFLNIVLKESNATLDALVVNGNATVIDRLSPIQTETLTTKTLAKAACCNLSESFETNASVTVSYADAVTGAKQIQMLGLSGAYIQTNVENIPNLRGLAATFGLNYIPGTWIQSIDIGKGVGSVVNGYENMAGVINVELKKPENSERLLLNAYLNHWGRAEINLNTSKKLNKKWSTGILSHASMLPTEFDRNNDGFRDLPKYNQINLINRWKYQSDKYMAQFGAKFLAEDRSGGQMGFVSAQKSPSIFGFSNQTRRYELFSKTAKLFQEKPYRGLGLILNYSGHFSESYFGQKPYLADQTSFYLNLIYQDKIVDTRHTYKTGISYLNDNYDEKLGGLTRIRNESVPGIFYEYTYNHLDRSVLLLGARLDHHNLFGTRFTPRLHFKQDIGQNDTWRLSAGTGFRVANPLAEYFGNLVSSRSVVFLEELKPEESLNLGTSYIKEIGKLSLSGEYYFSKFKNQMVADAEHDQYLYFYNLEGKSYTQSALFELNYGPKKNWEVKLAYKYVESKQTLGKPNREKILFDKMFLPRHRVLLNMAYALPYDRWKYDFTVQWNGKRRIPNAGKTVDLVNYRTMPVIFAPSFFNLNAQVSRNFPKTEIYLGGENLTNFRQKDPILSADQPFSNNFDAGLAWGPVVGATIYSGLRYKIP